MAGIFHHNCGKTYSSLRLATGIQRVTGGDIYGIDTESRRMLHYADSFKFRHLSFGEPFSPLDYLAAIQHCVNKGARTIIIDSMSHEHEGPGGVLEMHGKEMAGDFKKQFIAWAKPKAMRRRLINSMLQMNCNFIMCYRAKEKLKIVRGGNPEPRGWQPIAGEEYVYEATLNCLLLPASNGVPCWQPEHDNEGMIKLPAQFRGIFKDGPQLSEEIGVKLAEWSKGGAAPSAPVHSVSPDEVAALISEWKAWPYADAAKDKPAFVAWASETAGRKLATMRDWTPEIVAACRARMTESDPQPNPDQLRNAEPEKDRSPITFPGRTGTVTVHPAILSHEALLEAMGAVAQAANVPEVAMMEWIKGRVQGQAKNLAPKRRAELLAEWTAEVEANPSP